MDELIKVYVTEEQRSFLEFLVRRFHNEPVRKSPVEDKILVELLKELQQAGT